MPKLCINLYIDFKIYSKTKKMKKVFAILAIVALASCGGSETPAPAGSDSAAATTVANDSTPAASANDSTAKDTTKTN